MADFEQELTCEAIESVARIAREGVKHQWVHQKVEGSPKAYILYDARTGEIRGPYRAEPDETYLIDDVESLARFGAMRLGKNASPVLFLCEQELSLTWREIGDLPNICINEPEEIVRSATMRIIASPQMEKLERSDDAKFTQRQFWNFLRTELAEAVDQKSVAIFRRIKWRGSGESEAQVGVGKESLGRSVVQEVTGEAAIPDSLEIRPSVFKCRDLLDYRGHMRVNIDVDQSAQTFSYMIPAGDLDRVRNTALSYLASLCENAFAEAGLQIPIIRGFHGHH